MLQCAAIVLLLAGMALAATRPCLELKARADAAHGGEQAKLCLEYARRQLEDANALFTNGDVDKAQSRSREVVEYAPQRRPTLPRLGQHLKANRNQAAQAGRSACMTLANRWPSKTARRCGRRCDEIEQIRSDLMVRMWGPQAEPKGKS